ncbi:hypothetical protein J2Z57_003583 [Formosa algae]|uniref:Uncharacterized protein n=1 Tax=Formosa algae TaxID=225843 RepID=A0A9X0YPI1_9FLAO|nr:hypothetical protein [Formosa algae]MDQ0337121.1 hypothetical protein [Formosa algae]
MANGCFNRGLQTAKSAIKLYNDISLHLSLDYRTPHMVYQLFA